MERLGLGSLTQISRRRRSLLLACCALGAGGYLSYRVYTSDEVTRRRRRLHSFFHSLSLLLESAAQGSDCAAVLWRDLHAFLLSDQDEVPRSLTQLLKVGQTPAFQTSVALLCRSVTQGVVASLAGQGPGLDDGREYASALYEEESGLRIGRESGDGGRLSWKGRRGWRSSSAETDVAQGRDGVEEFRREKLGHSESASRGVHGGEAGRWSREEDEGGRCSPWRASRSGYRERASWQSAFDGAKSKSRSPGGKRGRVSERREEGLPERLVGKLFSEAGRGFASAVVASATRNLVCSVLEGMEENSPRHASQTVGGLVQWTPGVGQDRLSKGTDGGEFGEGTRKQSTGQGGMVDFLCSSKGRSLVADCIETFVGTAVAVYLEQTRDVNVFEEVVSTVSAPAHRESVRELLMSVCNGAVETFVRASIGSAAGPPPRSGSFEAGKGEAGKGELAEQSGFFRGEGSSSSSHAHLSELENLGDSRRSEGGANDDHVAATSSSPPRTPDKSESFAGFTRIAFDQSPETSKKTRPADEVEAIVLPSSNILQHANGKAVVIPGAVSEESLGWIDGVSRTLAVPSNRALVLDVAGTVTSEAVRSVIEVVASKVSLTFRGRRAKETVSTAEDAKSEEETGANVRPSGGSKVLHVINRTGEFAQMTAAKTMVAMTMCLAICLHTLVGPSRVLQLS